MTNDPHAFQNRGKNILGRHLFMNIVGDGARVTNLSLNGSRLSLTIEAELSDSQIKALTDDNECGDDSARGEDCRNPRPPEDPGIVDAMQSLSDEMSDAAKHSETDTTQIMPGVDPGLIGQAPPDVAKSAPVPAGKCDSDLFRSATRFHPKPPHTISIDTVSMSKMEIDQALEIMRVRNRHVSDPDPSASSGLAANLLLHEAAPSGADAAADEDFPLMDYGEGGEGKASFSDSESLLMPEDVEGGANHDFSKGINPDWVGGIDQDLVEQTGLEETAMFSDLLGMASETIPAIADMPAAAVKPTSDPDANADGGSAKPSSEPIPAAEPTPTPPPASSSSSGRMTRTIKLAPVPPGSSGGSAKPSSEPIPMSAPALAPIPGLNLGGPVAPSAPAPEPAPVAAPALAPIPGLSLGGPVAPSAPAPEPAPMSAPALTSIPGLSLGDPVAPSAPAPEPAPMSAPALAPIPGFSLGGPVAPSAPAPEPAPVAAPALAPIPGLN
ncbi:MAG: hypothetical protein LBU23_10970, partial [Planctomycetota bacterium]|nr:hypothetical protein [Planctomycetota bacterium]